MSLLSFLKKKDKNENSLIGEFVPENFNILIDEKKLELIEAIYSSSISNEELKQKRNNFLTYIRNVLDSKRLLTFFINDLYLLSQKIEITNDLWFFLYFIQGWQELLSKNNFRFVYIIDNDLDALRIINSKTLFDKFDINLLSLEVNRGNARFNKSDDSGYNQFSTYKECEEKFGKTFETERMNMINDFKVAVQNGKNIVCASKYFIKNDLEFFYNEIKDKQPYIGLFRVNAGSQNTSIICFKDENNFNNIFNDMK